MAEKKRRDKKHYLQDFQENPDGSYVYTGKTWHADETVRRRILVRLWALQAVMLVSVFLPGFATTAGLLNTFYVIIPYGFWLISDFVLAYTLGSMTFGGNPLRNYIYENSVLKYPFCALLPLVGAVMTAIALLIFLLRGGNGEGEIACFICCGIQVIASVFARRINISDIWRE